MPVATPIDGIVLLDKPAGLSSNEALQRVKHLFGARKAGHGGNLDPLASGMLPVCLGEATKLAGAMLAGRKCYEFRIRLGLGTTTGDLEGDVVERQAIPALAATGTRAVLEGFVGQREQVPPMHSALKHRGTRLYELARRGIEVPRPPRAIDIHALELGELTALGLSLRVICSKGTYVRTLAQDIAHALGTCGHVVYLRRAWVEPFDAEPMATLEALHAAAHDPAALRQWLLPPDRSVQSWPRMDLDAEDTRKLLDGQSVTTSASVPDASLVRMYGPAGRFLGIAQSDAQGRVRPRRLIASERDQLPLDQ